MAESEMSEIDLIIADFADIVSEMKKKEELSERLLELIFTGPWSFQEEKIIFRSILVIGWCIRVNFSIFRKKTGKQ